MRASIEEREHVHQLRDPELADDVLRDGGRCAAAVDRVRGRAQPLEADPHGGALVSDQMTPSAGPLLVALAVAAVRDGAGAGDEHDPAALWIPGVEGRPRVVRDVDRDVAAEKSREDRASALPRALSIPARAREDHRARHATRERGLERCRDGALRVRGGHQVGAAAGASADDLAGPCDGERAGLRPAGVDADDDRVVHGAAHGLCTAPAETARLAPVTRGSVFGKPRIR